MVNSPLIRPYLLGGYLRFPWWMTDGALQAPNLHTGRRSMSNPLWIHRWPPAVLIPPWLGRISFLKVRVLRSCNRKLMIWGYHYLLKHPYTLPETNSSSHLKHWGWFRWVSFWVSVSCQVLRFFLECNICTPKNSHILKKRKKTWCSVSMFDLQGVYIYIYAYKCQM